MSLIISDWQWSDNLLIHSACALENCFLLFRISCFQNRISCFQNRISCLSKQDFLWQETRLPSPNLQQPVITSHVPTPEANQENPVTFLPLCVKLRKTWFLSSNDETRWIPFLGLSTQLLVEGRVERRVNYPDEANVGVITRYKEETLTYLTCQHF